MTLSRARAAGLALAVAALAVPVAVTGFGLAAPAVAADSPQCASSQVAVAVNFSHWGKPVRLGCAQWSAKSTGYDVLRAAGFAVAGTTRYGPAFVCRLDGYPTAGAPDHEACVSTPSTKAYWSYWHADAGQTSWTYSTLGATSYHPHAGSVDAWTFGADAQPPFAPSSVLPARSASHPTSAAPTSRAQPAPPASGPVASSKSARVPARSTTGGGRRTSSVPTGAATARPTGSAATPAAAHPTSTSTATTTAKAGATTTAKRAGGAASAHPAVTSSSPSDPSGPSDRTGPTIVANDVVASRPDTSRGSVGPTVAAIVVIAVLAAAGGGYTWRRRRQSDHGG